MLTGDLTSGTKFPETFCFWYDELCSSSLLQPFEETHRRNMLYYGLFTFTTSKPIFHCL